MALDVLAVKDAARTLGVTGRRVWQMLDDGVLHPVADEPLLLSRSDVEHLAHVQSRSPGRPVSSVTAWDEISSFQLSDFADESQLDGWRRKMRPRADWRRFYAHRSVLSDLADSRLLVASGLRAAAFHGVPVEPDEQRFVGYVAAMDLGEILIGPEIVSGDEWNLELGIVANGSWRFGRARRFVDPVTAWLDLEDHRHRSARLLLETVLASGD